MRLKKILAALALTAPAVFAVSVELTWDRHPELDVTGYIAYWGPSTPFKDSMDVGKQERALLDNLLPNQSYRFAVRAYDRSRNLSALSSTLNFQTGPGVGLSTTPGLASAPVLSAVPNPFSDHLKITLSGISGAGKVTLLNIKGQKLLSAPLSADGTGGAAFLWDGRDRRGRALPPGIYLVNVRAGNRVYTQRAFLAR